MRGQLPGSLKTSEEKDKKNYAGESLKGPGLLIDAPHTCPVCDREFSTKEVKPGKAQFDGMDLDLRPCYKNIDALKYRIVECPECGFADFERYFPDVDKRTRMLLRERLIIHEVTNPKEEYERRYTDAYRYAKSALRCCLIRGAKSSKRAYTALFAAWLLRGWRESRKKDGLKVSDTDIMSVEEERKLKKYALRNFRSAESTESFPIMGMPESTFYYLMGVLCYEQDELNDAEKYILRALQDRTMKANLRTMAEDVREMIKKKGQSGAEY